MTHKHTHTNMHTGNTGQPCACTTVWEENTLWCRGSPARLHPSPHPGMITRMGNRALDFLQHTRTHTHTDASTLTNTQKAELRFRAMPHRNLWITVFSQHTWGGGALNQPLLALSPFYLCPFSFISFCFVTSVSKKMTVNDVTAWHSSKCLCKTSCAVIQSQACSPLGL